MLVKNLKILGRKIDNPSILIVEIPETELKYISYPPEVDEDIEENWYTTIVDFEDWIDIEEVNQYLESLENNNG